jgi:hypothetical protein
MPTDVTAVSRSRGTSRLDDSPDEEGPSSRSPSRLAPVPCPSQDGHRDEALVDACRNAPAASWNEARTSGPANDRILYVGINKDSAGTESRTLAARGVGLTAIESAATSSVRFQGHDYDLSDESGARTFANAVGRAYRLDPAKTRGLGDALAATEPRGRDELARIALAWAPAEEGAVIPSRMVLSGHSAAGLLMGGHGGSYLRFDDVLALAKVLPAAARQIEDVHLSACFTENQVQDAAKWSQAFPNLKTLWGYGGFAPLAPIGHLLDWEGATRGRADRLGERFVAMHGTATAWSLGGGIANAGFTIEERRAFVVEADRLFATFRSGERPIKDPHLADADRAYGAYRMLAAHSGATPAERVMAAARADDMLRLRFYERGVRAQFAQKHGAAIDSAFDALGLPRADFGTLSRKDALAVIAAFRDALVARPVANVVHVARVLDGLAELRPTVIEAGWCH